MRLRLVVRWVVVAALLMPAVAGARQTFQTSRLPEVTFKTSTGPELSLSTAPGRPATLRHVSGKQTIEAQAEGAEVTFTPTGLVVELKAGTYSVLNEPWKTAAHSFKTLVLEFSTNGELVSMHPSN